MATMTLIGAGVPTAVFADEEDNGDTRSIVIERNNQLLQNIEQEQEACTNEVEAEESGDGDNVVFADQDNNCAVVQTQTAANLGTITDFSTNDISAAIVDGDFFQAIFGNGGIPLQTAR